MPGDRLDLNHWDSDPALWQTLQINDEDVPGVAKCEATIGRKIEQDKPSGADGGRLKDGGLELAQIRVVVTYWTADHWAGIQDVIDRLGARRSMSQRDAVKIFHPSLAVLGISKAVCKSVGSPKPSSTPGAHEITLEFVEYNPPTRGASRARTPTMTFTDQESEDSNPDNRFAFDFGASDPDYVTDQKTSCSQSPALISSR
jgi:hypothetical protein